MAFRLVLYALLSFIFMKCNPDGTSSHTHTNHLAGSSSPYLLQHAHNPVDWYPWGEEALARAKQEDKLLIISIGYSACHWCHVMEHESFEDSTVAKVMNEHFVSIKVDREERPDIDDIYMTACHLASGGNCGWPLNAFALPDGKPVWAGTYFPKKQWLEVMQYFIDLKKNDPAKLKGYGDSLSTSIAQSEQFLKIQGEKKFHEEVVHDIADTLIQTMDAVWGGRKGAPKFPMPVTTSFLMHYAAVSRDSAARDIVLTNLRRMANGGIYDQIGGGFSRYSVDARWHVPHFEKMLYDNGQLVSLYADAYRWTKDPLFANVVTQTLDFIQRELTDDSGGFYASLDADSEREEGKFYVWTVAEIDALFSDEVQRKLVKSYYDIRSEGNWEHQKNVLQVLQPLEKAAENLNITTAQSIELLTDAKEKMLNAREKRVRPGLDDKILTSWNALMLKGYVDAYKALQKEDYLDAALKNADFLEKKMWRKDGGLNRNFKNGSSSINAFLDDYALVMQAFLALYEVTFDDAWLEKTRRLADYTLAHFADETSGMFFYTSDLDPPLIARKKELGDNVIPASNSILAHALHQLGNYDANQRYLDHAAQMLQNMADEITTSSQPGFYANWCDLYYNHAKPVYEIAIVGKDARALNHEMMQVYLPHAFFLGGEKEGTLPLLAHKLQEGETFIYVCVNKACKLPVQNIEDALALMQ